MQIWWWSWNNYFTLRLKLRKTINIFDHMKTIKLTFIYFQNNKNEISEKEIKLGLNVVFQKNLTVLYSSKWIYSSLCNFKDVHSNVCKTALEMREKVEKACDSDSEIHILVWSVYKLSAFFVKFLTFSRS